MKVFLNKNIGKYNLLVVEKIFHIYGEEYKNIESSIQRVDSKIFIFKDSQNYIEEFSKIEDENDVFVFLQKYS